MNQAYQQGNEGDGTEPEGATLAGMFRALMLAAFAAVIALFAAALLRAEGQHPAARSAEPAAEGGICTARTRSGAPCSRRAEPGKDRCWQHG